MRLFDFHAYAGSIGACYESELNINSMHTFFANIHSRSRLDQAFLFFAYICLIIKFTGVGSYEVIKCCPCNFRGKASFTLLFEVLQLSYNPSNFALANKPYAVD